MDEIINGVRSNSENYFKRQSSVTTDTTNTHAFTSNVSLPEFGYTFFAAAGFKSCLIHLVETGGVNAAKVTIKGVLFHDGATFEKDLITDDVLAANGELTYTLSDPYDAVSVLVKDGTPASHAAVSTVLVMRR